MKKKTYKDSIFGCGRRPQVRGVRMCPLSRWQIATVHFRRAATSEEGLSLIDLVGSGSALYDDDNSSVLYEVVNRCNLKVIIQHCI